MFFAGEFAEELIELGQADAQRWLDQHPADPWQLEPLLAWTQPPNGNTSARSSTQQAPGLAAASDHATDRTRGSNGKR